MTDKCDPRDLFSRVAKHWPILAFQGGNCGQVAFGIANYMVNKGQDVGIAFLTNNDFEDEEELTQGEPNVYHVLLQMGDKFFDVSGEQTPDSMIIFASREYGDEDPALWDGFEINDRTRRIINTQTQWSGLEWVEVMRFLKGNPQLTEGSYTEQGIPPYFYRVLSMDEVLKREDLRTGVLNHCFGISANPDIIDLFDEERIGAYISMPGQEVVAKNKLSRVDYNNIAYLFSSRMAAWRRIAGFSRRATLLNVVDRLLGDVFLEYFSLRTSYGGQPYGEMWQLTETPDNDIRDITTGKTFSINSLKDLYRFLRYFARESAARIRQHGVSKWGQARTSWDAVSSDVAHRQATDLMSIPYGDFETRISRYITTRTEEYKPEQEWIIKDHTLRIPPTSVLSLPSREYSPETKTQIENWGESVFREIMWRSR